MEKPDKKEVFSKASNASLKGAIAGWGCLVPLGGILSLTGLGLIFGVPMMAIGLILPILMGFVAIQKKS